MIPFRRHTRCASACLMFGMAATLSACASPGASSPDPEARGQIGENTKLTCPHVPVPIAAAAPPKPISVAPQVLQPGHWDWNDGGYVWTPPEWQRRRGNRKLQWIAGSWVPNGGACVWQNGAFASAPPTTKHH